MTAKTLLKYFDISTADAKKLSALIKSANDPTTVDKALNEADKILQGFGVEAIKDNGRDSYYCDIGLLYVNKGDTYTTTLVYDTRKKRFIIAAWGDIVEASPKRFS